MYNGDVSAEEKTAYRLYHYRASLTHEAISTWIYRLLINLMTHCPIAQLEFTKSYQFAPLNL